MSKVAHIGSTLNAPGGVVTEGKSFCTINGKPITHVGAKGTTHGEEGGGGPPAPGYSGPGDTTGPSNPYVGGGAKSWDLGVGGGDSSVHLAGTWWISKGSDFFKVDGSRVAVVGSETSCSHIVNKGEFVTVGGSTV